MTARLAEVEHGACTHCALPVVLAWRLDSNGRRVDQEPLWLHEGTGLSVCRGGLTDQNRATPSTETATERNAA